MNAKVGVGTGCFVVKDGKVLMGRRLKEGILSLPGGHLDFGETYEQCGIREIGEECGTDMKVRFKPTHRPDGVLWVSNNIMPAWGKHYITAWLVFEWISGEPINAEPHKCAGWDWYDFVMIYTTIPRLGEAFWAGKRLTDEQAQWIPLPEIFDHRYEIGIDCPKDFDHRYEIEQS